tara:strand:- start:484 stop:609 length:126 start_codon:yes stop_codon:yes gene_type:complete
VHLFDEILPCAPYKKLDAIACSIDIDKVFDLDYEEKHFGYQ